MITKYGEISREQLDEYKDRLHKKLFWLLLYKDPKTKDEYKDTNFDRYFSTLMKELKGLDSILLHPSGLLEMLSVLEAAYCESMSPTFDYMIYRKFVLDAHTLLDRINWEVCDDHAK